MTHTGRADWRRRHPTREVLSTDTGFERECARDPYGGHDRVQQLMFDVRHRDGRFPLKEWAQGLRVNRTVEAFDAQGRSLAGTMAFWFAWVAFPPRTEVLREP
jgi:hypothetical protein